MAVVSSLFYLLGGHYRSIRALYLPVLSREWRIKLRSQAKIQLEVYWGYVRFRQGLRLSCLFLVRGE